jgi:hypothetical protein
MELLHSNLDIDFYVLIHSEVQEIALLLELISSLNCRPSFQGISIVSFRS